MNIPTGRFVVPEKVVSHFHLREGDKVADFGAGSGFFAKALSRAVGSEGAVYLLDIQKNLVETCEAVVRREHIDNAEILWCDLEKVGGSKIEDGTLDAGILVNTLFQFEDKATALKEIVSDLRSGAKFFVIDWTESFGGLGPEPSAVVTAEQATDMCEAAGLVLEREFDAGDHHYGLAFRKP